MEKISNKKLWLANTETALDILFIKNIYTYIAVFFVSVFFINFSEVEQNILIDKYFYPIIITAVYILFSEFRNQSSRNINGLVRISHQMMNIHDNDRKEMSKEKVNKSALHEASHFIAFLKEDFENFSEINVRINLVSAKSKINIQRTSLESIYNNAFIKYISFVVEKKYNTSFWDSFTDSSDFKDFELLVRTYLINSKDSNFFINPINEIEASYNAKLINELKEKIENDCELFINKYEDFLIEVKNILMERDIETFEAMELLKKWNK